MKYKVLVLDHDDTVVDSTATIHFPCFLAYLKKVRPGMETKYDLKTYIEKNFDPGVTDFFLGDVGLTEKEFEEEQAFWADYVKDHIPRAYAGFADILRRFRAAGGKIAVDSHSYKWYIERDYKANGLPMPDIIYGWELPAEQRKPAPYTLFALMKTYGVRPDEMLLVDDLKPGYDMARAAGVPFAAAGWGYDVPAVRDFMKKNCDVYLPAVADLEKLLFS